MTSELDEKLRLIREMRTPTSQAWVVLSRLAERCDALHPEKEAGAFFDEVYAPIFHDEATSGDHFYMQACEIEKGQPLDASPFAGTASLIACAYSVQAMKADQAGERDKAWTYAVDATYWYAAFGGTLLAEMSKGGAVLLNTIKAGTATHARSRAAKAAALKWLETNIDKYPSMQTAADVIAKDALVAPRTAYRWVREWSKNRSS